jgi:hypothetical protein
MGNLLSGNTQEDSDPELIERILLTSPGPTVRRTPNPISSSGGSSPSQGPIFNTNDGYIPDYADIIILILNIYRASKVFLPLELIVSILTEYSGYVPITEKFVNRYVQAGNNADYKYLEINIPIYRYCRPDQVKVWVNSHDQGWSSNDRSLHRTRSGSYTWGEVALSSSSQTRYEVYRNIHACSNFEFQSATFGGGNVFMKKIAEEYRCRSFNCFHHSALPFTIVLFVRSLFPGWTNHINYAKIQITWKLSKEFMELILGYMKKYPVKDYNLRPLAVEETTYAEGSPK